MQYIKLKIQDTKMSFYISADLTSLKIIEYILNHLSKRMIKEFKEGVKMHTNLRITKLKLTL